MGQRAPWARQRITARDPRGYLTRLLAVAVAYYLAARLGLLLSLVGNSVTPIWPPTGVAVVALLAFRLRMWPAIALAAFVVNAPISPSWTVAAVIAAGNTVAPVVSAVLLARLGFDARLQRVRDAVVLVFPGALLSMAISATVGTAALVVSDAVASDRFLGTWSVWWTGDAMGVLIVAPFLWALARPGPFVARGHRLAVGASGVLLVGVCAVAFTAEESVLFLVVLVLGWIAWRFEQPVVAPAALVVSTLATFAAVQDAGPFADHSLPAQMITLQSFNATVVFVSIVMASAVAERQQRAEREHDVVETLQRTLLPERVPEVPGLAVAVRYIPATSDVKVGGDWYDIVALRDGRLGLAVGDVAGHGIPAAAVMGQLRMALRTYIHDDLAPATTLERLNRVSRDLQPDAMATVWYGRFDPATNRLTYSCAGHPPPLVIDASGATRFLEAPHGPPLGALVDLVYRQSEVTVTPDSALLLYTDGLVENRSADIDARFEVLRQAAATGPDDLDALCDHVVRACLQSASRDDVALVAVRPVTSTQHRLHFSQPASTDSVPIARHALNAWFVRNQVDSAVAFESLVAATEAYANAVRHAYDFTPGTVEIDAAIEGDELRIAVKDQGAWRSRPDGSKPGGRGLVLMRALMDTVEIDATASGTHVRMRRTLNGNGNGNGNGDGDGTRTPSLARP